MWCADCSLTGCSIGYEMNRYPQFQSVNSQVVEQANYNKENQGSSSIYDCRELHESSEIVSMVQKQRNC